MSWPDEGIAPVVDGSTGHPKAREDHELRVGIMQPYFLPYIGYFQLIEHCDLFVVYDNIQYSKRGWINRNRILVNGEPKIFTVPLEKASDYLDIRDRRVSDTYSPVSLERLFDQAYGRVPRWRAVRHEVREALYFEGRGLFEFTRNSLTSAMGLLGIDTRIVTSSDIDLNPSLRGQDRVLATCKALGATHYVNPIGGLDLYDAAVFAEHGVALSFLKSRLSPYQQQSRVFVPALSIVDILASIATDDARQMVTSDFDIIRN